MSHIKLTPKKALNKAYLKVKPHRDAIEDFKTNLIQLLDNCIDGESEEYHKNLVAEFLKKTYYDPAHYINTKGRSDLVIHNGPKNDDSVGVLIEAKSPTNKSEMISGKNINTKATQELLFYYLKERIAGKNLEVKHLVVTNVNEWYIFDAQEFDSQFAQDKKLVKQFTDFQAGTLSGIKTDFFYKEIAAPALAAASLTYTYFSFADYDTILRNADKKDDRKLIALYKLLSPEHLLKLPFANDSNSLDKKFYSELLHIIGLAEVKDGGKKLIQRATEKERNKGTLLESAILQLDVRDKLSRIDNLSSYGTTTDQKLFGVGLELVITWVNRILFLKLLEGQLVSYHKGDTAYTFMQHGLITDFDTLDALFFQVLAKKQPERRAEIQEQFGHVPYLNSSLFEPQDIEHNGLFISEMPDDVAIPLYSATVLKDENGKKRKGALSTLEYLFAFLDAYDFASEGKDEIQEDNKQLINASVLGLIFEKINGYKDGSFFTPGFITMYMCQETIRRAVLQKFEEAKGWKCETIADLQDKIEDKKEANELVNSLKICDPAVGSGHFLVSALNEIIAIKSELDILLDREGKRLKYYHVTVENDELVITDEDGDLFEYHYGNKEQQRIQETLFHEKQTIIENCLFGVDINPNSVKICRLRLWIELLKNSYYKAKNVLETLPNIDINIKCGNSLISRFDLDVDIRKALKKSKYSIDAYRVAVHTYRNASDKEEKRAMEKLIHTIKSDFRSEISTNDPKVKQLNKLGAQLFEKYNNNQLFDVKLTAAQKRDRKALNGKIEKLQTDIEDIKNNKIYENAFEWRFEFPEVLDDDGSYIGFDVVIGNPPYIRHEELSESKDYFRSRYNTFQSTADIYVYFMELGLQCLKENGCITYIVPNKWMKASYGVEIRNQILTNQIREIIDFGDLPVFEEATTYPSILNIIKGNPTETFTAANISTLNYPNGLQAHIEKNKIEVSINGLDSGSWTLTSTVTQNVIKKINKGSDSLGNFVKDKMFYGIKTGFNEAFIIDEKTKDMLIAEDQNAADIIKPFLGGKDIKKYQSPENNKWLITIENGYSKKLLSDLKPTEMKIKMSEQYPSVFNWFKPFESKLKIRSDKGQYWWELRACAYMEDFEKNKLVWAETSSGCQFCMIPEGIYLNKTTFMIPSSDLALLAILNSKVVEFYLSAKVSKVRGGYFSMSKVYVENVPIKYPEDTKLLASKSQEIIAFKKEDPKADTSALEAEIDAMMYALYGLSEEEIKIVEGV
jgi:type II restriction/modification system DNA methylase subunit YeeA